MRDIKEIKAILIEKNLGTETESTRWHYVITFTDGSSHLIGTTNGYGKDHFKFAVVNTKKKSGYSLSNSKAGFPITRS